MAQNCYLHGLRDRQTELQFQMKSLYINLCIRLFGKGMNLSFPVFDLIWLKMTRHFFSYPSAIAGCDTRSCELEGADKNCLAPSALLYVKRIRHQNWPWSFSVREAWEDDALLDWIYPVPTDPKCWKTWYARLFTGMPQLLMLKEVDEWVLGRINCL